MHAHACMPPPDLVSLVEDGESARMENKKRKGKKKKKYVIMPACAT